VFGETGDLVLQRAPSRGKAIALRARHFTGFVDDADMPYLYGACDLFIFPSFYEGFGCRFSKHGLRRAVACSNTTAMPEVADAAGILFDPFSKAEMISRYRRRAVGRRIAHPAGASGNRPLPLSVGRKRG